MLEVLLTSAEMSKEAYGAISFVGFIGFCVLIAFASIRSNERDRVRRREEEEYETRVRREEEIHQARLRTLWQEDDAPYRLDEDGNVIDREE
jgi:hypothetical protein